jgi:hypothetical protein
MTRIDERSIGMPYCLTAVFIGAVANSRTGERPIQISLEDKNLCSIAFQKIMDMADTEKGSYSLSARVILLPLHLLHKSNHLSIVTDECSYIHFIACSKLRDIWSDETLLYRLDLLSSEADGSPEVNTQLLYPEIF